MSLVIPDTRDNLTSMVRNIIVQVNYVQSSANNNQTGTSKLSKNTPKFDSVKNKEDKTNKGEHCSKKACEDTKTCRFVVTSTLVFRSEDTTNKGRQHKRFLPANTKFSTKKFSCLRLLKCRYFA